MKLAEEASSHQRMLSSSFWLDHSEKWSKSTSKILCLVGTMNMGKRKKGKKKRVNYFDSMQN